MKILGVTVVTSYIVETDAPESPDWRRGPAEIGSWENLMGESWEGMEPPDGLEELFQGFMPSQEAIMQIQNGKFMSKNKYGLLTDDGYDSQVDWFDSVEEAVKEYVSHGYLISELASDDKLQGTMSIVTKMSLEEIKQELA